MRKLLLCTAGLVGLAMGGAAQAAITFTVSFGTDPYSGPTPTYDFETALTTPVFTGGQVQSTSNSTGAAPFPGNMGNFYTVGPAPGNSTPGVIDLSSFGDIENIYFIWGSVDTYNDLDFLAADGITVLGTFNGALVGPPANGGQGDPATNVLVRFDFTGADIGAVSYMRLRSTQQAFEIDNLAINAVPEPTTWALFILGFGAIGATMRRRNSNVRNAKAALHFA